MTVSELSQGIWEQMRIDAKEAAGDEPALSGLLRSSILDRETIADALARELSRKLGAVDDNAPIIQEICAEALRSSPALFELFVGDMNASYQLDPACRSWLQPFLYFKGVAALQTYRVAHWLWGRERMTMAFHLQSLSSQIFQVDIHPAAKLGAGIFLDHATGVVIGETSVVGDDVTILQSVTLGGNGKERGDRHPKIGNGVLISVGAKVLGNITVGEGARIAASSVVLQNVPPHATVAGVPAKIVRGKLSEHPAQDLDHSF